VILGKTDKNSEEISIMAKSITVHPDYKEKEDLNDLAIVEIPGVTISSKLERYKASSNFSYLKICYRIHKTNPASSTVN
jgi:hypothetical protein